MTQLVESSQCLSSATQYFQYTHKILEGGKEVKPVNSIWLQQADGWVSAYMTFCRTKFLQIA